MTKVITREIDLNGRKLKLETGKLALQADAAVLASWGETVVLCTVANQPLKESLGYFPLSVEYIEKYYAGGIITSQRFIKRETRPPDEAVLAGRAIDRAIRPLFPQDFPNEVQVMVTVLSFDGVNDPVTLGMIGTSAALSLSSVPWAGPLGIARVGEKEGEFVINSELPELEKLDLNLLVVAGREKVVMIEAEGKEVEETRVLAGIKKGQEEAQKIIDLIDDFVKERGVEKQSISALAQSVEEAALKEVEGEIRKKIEAALSDSAHPWHEGTGDLIKKELGEKYADSLTSQMIGGIFDKIAKEIIHDLVLGKKRRVDGRGMEEIRPIEIEVGILPHTHGSALFQRGGTQVLSVVTLGPLSLAQTLEGMVGEREKRFMHHYNMSINPFSVGEARRIGAPNRRDIGHGALAEKALVPLLPSEEDFPYAVRVVSEVLAANASTSMASVCASTIALLNAGVKLQNPVAGIALGLFSNDLKKEVFQVVTDMQAVEDFYGEMDFKMAGTEKGLTAIQMDTKLAGLSLEIIEKTLKQGREALNLILEKIRKVIPEAGEISQYAPRIEVTHIDPAEIGILIGPGGKNINGIIARTGAQVDIEEDGTVMISSSSLEAVKKALEEVEGMFKKVGAGEVYEGKVTKIVSFGAFVEILPGKEGLVHISQMAPYRVERAEDIVSVGQSVKVRVTEVDPAGKIALSMLFGADIKRETEGSPRFRSGEAGKPRFEGRRDFGRRQPFDRRSQRPFSGSRSGPRAFGSERSRVSQTQRGKFDRRGSR